MIFWLNGKRYKLQGLPNNTRDAQFNSIQQIEAFANSNSFPSSDLEPVFEEFPSVFEKFISLPPFRIHSHAIPLLPGTSPPNLRSYSTYIIKRKKLKSKSKNCWRRGSSNLGLVLSQAQSHWLQRKMGCGDFVWIIGNWITLQFLISIQFLTSMSY